MNKGVIFSILTIVIIVILVLCAYLIPLKETVENTSSIGGVLVFDYTGTIVNIYTSNESDTSEITYVEVDTNENGKIVFEVDRNTTIEGTNGLSIGQQIAVHCEYSNHRHYAISITEK